MLPGKNSAGAMKMTIMSLQAIKKEISKLDKVEQVDLMHYLMSLLTDGTVELSPDVRAELDRREAALEAGMSVGKPAREVIAKYLTR